MNKSVECEVWRDVVGFEGEYQVSPDGKVKSLKKTPYRIMKTYINPKTGYEYVGLCKDGNRHMTTVHRLVAETFIPNPDNLPCINHKDENKTNNYADNLEWCTYQYNLTYGTHTERAQKTRHKLGWDKYLATWSQKNREYLNQRIRETSCKRVAKIDKETGEVLKIYESIADAEIENKCSHISACIQNTRNESGGYIWQSVESIENNKHCIDEAIDRIKKAKTQYRKGKHKGNFIVQYDLSDNIINKFNSIKEAAIGVGCKEGGISACLNNRQKTAYGYKWGLEPKCQNIVESSEGDDERIRELS